MRRRGLELIENWSRKTSQSNNILMSLCRFKTTDYPFLCMGYKIPPGVPVSIAVNVMDYGWRTIPLINCDGGSYSYPSLTEWENGINSDTITDDNEYVKQCFVNSI